jgi:predicted short-subunit dehydrogenase-like oxidoreductase (DUF2520 family)
MVILGAGNVAAHMARHLHSGGHSIACIWSRTKEHADDLASLVRSRGTADPDRVPGNADFYLVAVPDRAITPVASKFRGTGGIWIHTAGAVPMDIFEKDFSEYGVIYPLQTLSAARPVSLKGVPLLIEGSGSRVTEMIRSVAGSISDHVIEMDSARRLVVHVAAVFANNFSNHMVAVAEHILKVHEIDPALLAPMLRETFEKIAEMGPEGARTGPAARDDRSTMLLHRELLKKYPEWEKLYTFISRDIQRYLGPPTGNPGSGDD